MDGWFTYKLATAENSGDSISGQHNLGGAAEVISPEIKKPTWPMP